MTADSWLEAGRLIRVWRGVYAVGHVPPEPRARAYGAMLAAGDLAALAGWSAGAHYGAARRWPEPVELISPRRCRVTGLQVHICTGLAGRDVWRFAEYGGLRVTSPARTALDLVPRLGEDRVRNMVDHLRLRHHLNLDQLRDVLARNPRHPGARPLKAILPSLPDRASRSKLERFGWPAFAKSYGVGPYRTNVMVGGHEVDVLVDELVIVEIDTLETHLLTFESDRTRDREILSRTGIPVIRVTDVQLRREPAQVAGDIRAAVARRRAEMGQTD